MQSGRKVGSLPYVVQHLAGGQTLCCMPRLTPLLGPATEAGEGAAANRALRRAQITRDLLLQLPPCSGYLHTLHRGTTDTMVYQELGYETSVQFVFEVAPAPPDGLWRAMREPVRALIEQNESRYRIRWLDGDAPFASPGAAASAWAGADTKAAARVCRAAIARGQGGIVGAETLAGTLKAAILVVWDTQAAYCVLARRRRDCTQDIMVGLLWHAMQAVSARGLTFELDGTGAASPEQLAGLGGKISPRYVVSRMLAACKLAVRVRSSLHRNATGAVLH